MKFGKLFALILRKLSVLIQLGVQSGPAFCSSMLLWKDGFVARPNQAEVKQASVRDLPRNVWAVSLTSFFTYISSEMVINVLPLFLASVLGVKTSVIGLIQGVAEATASILKLFSGWLSDRAGERKWLAVAGYAISAWRSPSSISVRPGRWSWPPLGYRVGKGIRTAPCMRWWRPGRSEAARAGLRLPSPPIPPARCWDW